MVFDYAENSVQLLSILLALLASLFHYIGTKSRMWLFSTAMFVSMLLSSYFWTSYIVIMGDYPVASDLFAYGGVNVAYVFLLLIVVSLKRHGELSYFHPLMLVPVPLNLWQLRLYLPYGGVLNNVYQVTTLTIIACLSIQDLCWYWTRGRTRHGTGVPYVAIAALVFVTCEFGMWTPPTLFYEHEWPYYLYYVSTFCWSADFLFIVWAIARQLEPAQAGTPVHDPTQVRYQNMLRATSILIVSLCAIGGILLARWIRDTAGEGASDVIPVVLFTVSVFLAAFFCVIAFAAGFGERAFARTVTGEGHVEEAGSGVEAQPALERDEAKVGRANLLIPMGIIFCLMVLMVVYTSRTIMSVSVANIQEVGQDRISGVAAQLENYLDRASSILWVTSDTAGHMVGQGEGVDEVLAYLVDETDLQAGRLGESFTGLYGYVGGSYLDGSGWVPPTGFDPTRRPWYAAAVAAAGDVAIVAPYRDVQTGQRIVTLCRSLPDGTGVVALDLKMDHIQDLVDSLGVKGKGFGLILDSDGVVVAHRDEAQAGRRLTDGGEEERDLAARVLEDVATSFETIYDRELCTVFSHQVLGQWNVVICVPSAELYDDVWRQLTVNVLICVVIFSLVAFFYLMGRRNERTWSQNIDHMHAEQQRRTFEAEVLRLEKEAADQANQAKSDFLASMSHEIRTPINAVLGMNEMVMREADSARRTAAPETRAALEDISGYASNIEGAGKSLLAIVNDILDFSKIEAGRMDIVEAPYSLGALLSNVCAMVALRAEAHGLDFQVDVGEDIPDALVGDEVRLRQVITNLLGNAVKYTEAGFVRLEVGASWPHGSAAAGQELTLTVAVVDSGIGIRPEDQALLFAKFQRVDLAHNSTIEGTGLGLAITRSLLDLMGGTISVESHYGRGSTFTVRVPQRAVSLEPVAVLETGPRREPGPAARSEGLFVAPDATILIVDDTRMNLTVATGLLRDTRIECVCAESGERAIALCRERAFDAILMDQRMPEMDGTETMRRIRDLGPRFAEVPVVCLTADAVSGARERYLAEGFSDYLTKPVEGRTLRLALMRCLPKDKVLPPDALGADNALAPEGSGKDGGHGDLGRALEAAGIDVAAGLAHCQRDEGLYADLLAEYVRAAGHRREGLERACAEADWEAYAILAHATKSSSRMVGAEGAARVAERLEAAADAGRARGVRDGNPALLQALDAAVASIERALEAAGAAGGTGAPFAPHGVEVVELSGNEDDVVFEFLPEEETD